MLNISSENNEIFNIFETKHFNFSFQDVILGEIKCFGFTQNHFFKKSLLKNKEQVFLLIYHFFPCSHSQPKISCLCHSDKKDFKTGCYKKGFATNDHK